MDIFFSLQYVYLFHLSLEALRSFLILDFQKLVCAYCKKIFLKIYHVCRASLFLRPDVLSVLKNSLLVSF